MSLNTAPMNSKTTLVVLAAIALASCGSSGPEQPAETKLERPFASAGNIEMQLEGGDYTIRAGAGDNIRVSFAGNTGNASANLNINGASAQLTVKDTPHSNFRATIEVPPAADITVHLTGGNLQIGAIAGNKDIDSKAGNVTISIPKADDYGSVDASVTAGNLDGGPFGKADSGVSPHVKWSGPGKYTVRAVLGAGNLEFKR